MTSNDAARDMLATAAALLDQGRGLDWLSRLVTVTALAVLAALGLMDDYQPVLAWALILSVLAGLIETYFAVRVAFDAALFHRAANALVGPPEFAGIDAALARMGLVPAGKAGRALEARVDGAVRLLKGQVAALAGQILLVLLGAAYATLV